MLTSRQKQKVIGEHQIKKEDTGSVDVQVALISKQIDELVVHLKRHSKDNHSRLGLLKLVGKRRRLLNYLSRRNPKNYAVLVKKLGLKK